MTGCRHQGVTGRIIASTGSSDLVPNALGFGRASFNLEAQCLFPDGVFEGEERELIGWGELLFFSEFGAFPQNTSKGM